MPYDRNLVDALTALNSLGGLSADTLKGILANHLSPDEISAALNPSVTGGLVRGGGFLDTPQANWGHAAPYRGTPGQFMFRGTLPLEGALRLLPQNPVLDALRAFRPQIDFRAVSNNLWNLPNEYGVGITGGIPW